MDPVNPTRQFLDLGQTPNVNRKFPETLWSEKAQSTVDILPSIYSVEQQHLVSSKAARNHHLSAQHHSPKNKGF
jgi:hypothetical protein